MGITIGLFAGRSGLESHGNAIAALSDVITNSNTVGYKPERVNFSDIVNGGLGGGASGSGAGSEAATTTRIFTQGSFERTGRALDAAIDGNGLFVVRNTTNEFLFTRAGNFTVDKQGNLLDQNGLAIMGFSANGSGGLEELNINNVTQSNISTTEVNIGGNLDAAATVQAVPGGTPTFAQLSTDSKYSTFVTLFDSLGTQHDATVYFFKTASNTWDARAYVNGSDVTGGTAGLPSLIGSATMNFTAAGALSAPATFTGTANWNSGATSPATMDFSFAPFTQYAAQSNVSSVFQDGTGGGSVTSFAIESNGSLQASLSNGQVATIGTIALATFANIEGLRRAGGSLFAQTNASGEPVLGRPATGVFGSIQAESVELSTGDIANAFTSLITLSRGFQGSSRIITKIDDLLNEIINLAS